MKPYRGAPDDGDLRHPMAPRRMAPSEICRHNNASTATIKARITTVAMRPATQHDLVRRLTAPHRLSPQARAKKAEFASLETFAFGQSTTRLVSHGPVTLGLCKRIINIYIYI